MSLGRWIAASPICAVVAALVSGALLLARAPFLAGIFGAAAILLLVAGAVRPDATLDMARSATQRSGVNSIVWVVVAVVVLSALVILVALLGALLIPVVIYLGLAASSPPRPPAKSRIARSSLLGIFYVGWILLLAIGAMLAARQANDLGNPGLTTDGLIVGGLALLILAALPAILWPFARRITAPLRISDK